MNLFDIIVIGVVLLSGLFAFARGFVKEALSVAAWVVAGFAALYALPYTAPVAERFLPKGPFADGAAGLLVFIVALIVLSFATTKVANRVQKSALSAVDHTLGLIFGVVRGVLLICLGYLGLTWTMPAGKEPLPSWISEAKTLPYLKIGAERLSALLPAAYRQKLETTMTDTRRAAQQTKEAAGAMDALTTPRHGAAPPDEHRPTYTPDTRRDLDRLIQQEQQSH
jgi:membrane protein required for colicin V production